MNRKRRALRSFGYFLNTFFMFLGLPLLGWDLTDINGFFAQTQNTVYSIVIAMLAVGACIQSFNNPEGLHGSIGKNAKRIHRQSVVRYVITILLFLALVFLPYADKRGIGVFSDNPALRWTGLFCFSAGIALVFWSGAALGRYYSAEVTIQADHHLITTGPYKLIRHPRYTGGIQYAFGFALLFRSWIGVIGILLTFFVFLQRIKDEEALMHSEFGNEWEAYCQRTWRLIPFVF
jgi:protein-S-isoprenylcysteine O-methyltransferase Ste14